MNKVNNIWVIADRAGQIPYLTSAASQLGENVVLVYIGESDDAAGSKKAYRINIGKDESPASYASAIAAFVADAQPELVLTSVSSNGRLIAGLTAAVLNAGLMTDVTELSSENGVHGRRMVFGGAAFKSETSVSSSTVVCLGEGVYETLPVEKCADVEDIVPERGGIAFISRQVKEAKSVNLNAAKNIISVGRGAAKAELLEQIRGLAATIGAEVGCTRPIAEEEKLMPKETYIGVSGIMLKPEFYLGIGVSGQIQHMVGVNQANVIAAINKDKNAPIFKECDYGLVADINEVLPILREKLK